MKNLKDKLKQYHFLSSIVIKLMMIFYFILDHIFYKKKKQILFVSFTGRQYSDSPKAIYLAMKNDTRFEDYELKWAFLKPEQFPEIDSQYKVAMNSLQYYLALFQSCVWISNANLERLVPYKSKKILYVNTWHGIPLKYIGKDEYNVDEIVGNWFENMEADLITACGFYDEAIFKHVFPKAKQILRIGLPRNDELKATKHSYPTQRPLKVLYAPTFRKNHDIPLLCKSNIWEKSLNNVELWVRFHYFENADTIFKDVSTMDLNRLLKEADVLITDYSSMMFDFAKLEKPVLLYPYDKEEYIEERGIYFNLDELPWTQAMTEKDIIAFFNGLSDCYDEECHKTKIVNQEFHQSLTSQTASDYILNYIEKEVNV